MPVNRRQFIQVTGLALCGVGSMTLMAQSDGTPQPLLPIPPLLESRGGQALFLTLQGVHWSFINGQKTAAWGINGQYPGPTIRVRKDDDVKLVYCNRLAESISMTISGLQVPGAISGGATRIIPSGQDWSPVVPVRQRAATCWYHTNTPNRMAPHMYNGLAGMWLVEDDISQSLPLPNKYGVDDFPIILQDKRLDNLGVPRYRSPVEGGFIGDTLLVNGVQSPFIEVSRGWVRLRLLNASNSRCYTLQLSNGRPLHVVASDQGFLSAPVAAPQLSLAPGERLEVVIDMSKGAEVSITAGQAAGIVDRIRGLVKPSNRLNSTLVLTLKPGGLLSLVTNSLPVRLLASDFQNGNIVRSREFRLGDVQPGINGVIWDTNRIDVHAQQGTWERWTIYADMAQAFHVQGVSFLVSKVNGAEAAAEDRGWKDTVWVDGDVELLVYFNQVSSKHFPFLYYSQTLEMADRGSVGQLVIQPATV